MIDYLWRLGRYLAAHGVVWTIDGGELYAKEIASYRNGDGPRLFVEEWVRIDASFDAVRAFLGY